MDRTKNLEKQGLRTCLFYVKSLYKKSPFRYNRVVQALLNVIDYHCFWKTVPAMQQVVSLILHSRM